MVSLALIRLLLFLAFVLALGLLCTRLWQLYDVFDPPHWYDFVRKNFSGPIVTILVVFLLWIFQEPIACWILAGTE